MAAAHIAGVAASEFWNMTPWQLRVITQASIDKAKNEQELMTWHAWHVAALGRTKKMPTLKEMLGKKEPKKDFESRLMATIKDVKSSKKKA